MKQIFLLVSIFCSTVLLSQTVLTSYPLDLKKNSESNAIQIAQNEVTHEVFVFIDSEDSFKILRYNSALFLTDEFTSSKEYTEGRTLSGFSFGEDGNPTLYWSAKNTNFIIILKYYFETKTSKALKFSFPPGQIINTEYQNNNTFYILTQHTAEPKLILYVFKNGIAEEKVLDFSSFTFLDRKAAPKTFNQILRENPIEKMETGEYNPLYKVTAKAKMYALKDRIILTLDHNLAKTQLFDIDLNTLTITEKNFLQPNIQKVAKSSNSFYHENKLFQINTNENELSFEIKDLKTEQVIKTLNVSKKDTIRFKNSPFLAQRDNNKPRELKNTAKFLQLLSSTNIGLSVFKNKDIFLTFGGFAQKNSYWEYYSYDDMFNNNSASPYSDEGVSSTVQSVFFESIWDKKFEPTTKEQQPLAVDKIYLFMDEHKEVSLESILKFKNYSILGYFDTTTKQYTMRKFSDGYN